MATRRANHAATAPPATAKRGRLSERAWSDVLRAARIARAEGVALRVHGIEIYNKRKPQKLKNKVLRQEQKKPTETVAPTLPSTANGVKVASLRSSRPSSYALDTLQGRTFYSCRRSTRARESPFSRYDIPLHPGGPLCRWEHDPYLNHSASNALEPFLVRLQKVVCKTRDNMGVKTRVGFVHSAGHPSHPTSEVRSRPPRPRMPAIWR